MPLDTHTPHTHRPYDAYGTSLPSTRNLAAPSQPYDPVRPFGYKATGLTKFADSGL